jgi:hypothetical protein
MGAIAGTNCTADAPLPTTATRLPVRSTPWSQREEWNTGPSNPARPGMSGRLGVCHGPAAAITARAVMSPSLVDSSHRAVAGFHWARRTSTPNRTCSVTPCPLAVSRR